MRAGCVVAIGLLWFLPYAHGRAVRFATRTDLPSLGIQTLLPAGSMPAPLPPVQTYHYTVRRGDETWQEELYAPAELWRHSQTAGRWATPDGTTLLLGVVTHPLPGGFEREHVSRETFRSAGTAAGSIASTAWQEDTVRDWLRHFASLEAPAFTTVRRPTMRIRAVKRIDSPSAPSNRLMYLVLPAWNPVQVRAGNAHWIYVQLDLAAGLSPAASRGAVETGLIAAMTPSSRPAGPTAVVQDQAGPDERQRSREAAIASIQNLREWWHDETEHYVILTDLPARHRILVNELKTNLERMRALYARVVPPIAPVQSMSVIRIFEHEDDYLRYAGPEHRWTGGLWMPSRQELVIRPSTQGSTRDQRRHMLGVAYHEGFHQYAFYALGRRVIPPWFDEGHAEFFETAEIRGPTVTLPENDRSAAIVEALLTKGPPPIAALLKMDHQAFYSRDDTQRQENYALAWALVTYLHKGAPTERPARYHTICDRFLDALAQGADGPAATRQAFDPVNMERFIAQFTAFWTSRSRRNAARQIRYQL